MRPVDLWTGPLTRASRLSAQRAHLWMAGWTTLRVAHAPIHRPSAAHKLHRPDQQKLKEARQRRQSPSPRSGIRLLSTTTTEVLNTLKSLPSLQSNSRNPAPDRNRSRSRNHRSRSPKYATGSGGRPSASAACPPICANWTRGRLSLGDPGRARMGGIPRTGGAISGGRWCISLKHHRSTVVRSDDDAGGRGLRRVPGARSPSRAVPSNRRHWASFGRSAGGTHDLSATQE